MNDLVAVRSCRAGLVGACVRGCVGVTEADAGRASQSCTDGTSSSRRSAVTIAALRSGGARDVTSASNGRLNSEAVATQGGSGARSNASRRSGRRRSRGSGGACESENRHGGDSSNDFHFS